MKPKKYLVPDYYPAFRCIGGACEDSCCIGWNISVEETAYQRYQKVDHPTLTPLFRQAIVAAPKEQRNVHTAAYIQKKPDGRCSFLKPDGFCLIQSELGEEALCDTCASYPRNVNFFGGQNECSLGISCPEAARQVLLHPDPIQFIVVDADPALAKRTHLAPAYRFPLQGSGDPTQITTLNDLRGLIIGILQFRELELGARLMVLGFLLDDVDKVVSAPGFRNAAEIVPVLQGYADFLSSPQTAAVQFSQLAGNLPRKLHLIGGVITELLASQAKPRLNACLLAASEGLLAEGGDDAALVQRYTAALNENFAPFLREHGYMLENYLVNQVYSRLFPFTRASYLDLYRELVCSLAVLQVLLVGMAARDGHLETRQALQLLQSFARKAHHNPTYLDKLLNAAGATGPGAFVDVMWLLKDE